MARAPWYFESGYNDSMIMRPYLTHGLVPREIDPARRDRSSRPSGWKQCRWTLPRHVPRTVPRRARVIPPIIKLLSCGWHPRATRGTRHCPLTPPPPRLHAPLFILPSSSFLPPSPPPIPSAPSGSPRRSPRRSADQMLRTFAAKDRSFLVVSGLFQID